MNLDYYLPHQAEHLGLIRILASEKGLCRVDFVEAMAEPATPSDLTATACAQLHAYFNHRLQHFTLPLDMGGTAFQQQVWQALQTIPYGHTCSYADVSEHIQRPNAQRAVGAANGKNPISIIVPCHRVIGKSGQLTGYSGGLNIKAWLLQHEQQMMG
ncbi:MAG: methylated-DNA--[protein]-cysteine S-methyltransferase [Neisseriaceae bacterium]|nr:methylated-DNA--[protein]-cysteine S-methyltransferase [Neisseriaceae bacterium]